MSSPKHVPASKKETVTQKRIPQALQPDEELSAQSDAVVDLQKAKLNPAVLSPGAVLQLQRTIGNRAAAQLLGASDRNQATAKSTPIQSQLKANPKEDEYEQADQEERRAGSIPTVQKIHRQGPGEGEDLL